MNARSLTPGTARRPSIRAASVTCSLALAATLTLGACSSNGGGSTGPQGTPNQTAKACGVAPEMTFATAGTTATLDPGTIDQSASIFIQPAYEPLIRRNPQGEYVPGLATEWGYVGEGNKRFDLTLREGVTFSDGGALTPEGVKQHFEYIQNAGGPNAAQLAGMTFEVTGPLKVQLNLANPNPILEELLSQDWVIGLVASPKALANPKSLGTSTAGAGEYVLDTSQTVAGDHYVYTANPDYWDQEAIHFKKMTIRVIGNPNSILNALKTGEVDVAIGDYTTASGARAAGLQVAAQPTVWQGLGLFDRAGKMSEPLADVRVRQAINYAIDREAVTQALYSNDGLASSQIALPGSDDYSEATADFYAYDPERAEQLLEEAGYGEGFEVDALSTDFANIGLAGQAVAAQLEKVGIRLNLEEKDVNAYFEDTFSAQYPIVVSGLGSPPMHITGTLVLLPTGPFNPFKTEDKQLLSTYDEAAKAAPEERKTLNQQIVARIQEQGWFAPVTFTPVYYFGAADMGGLLVSEGNRLLNPVELFSTDC